MATGDRVIAGSTSSRIIQLLAPGPTGRFDMQLSIQIAGELAGENSLAELRDLCRRSAAEYDWAAAPLAGSARGEASSGASDVASSGLKLYPHGAEEAQAITFAFDAAGALEPWRGPIVDADSHARLIELLRKAAPLFSRLEVIDESGYWESNDRAALEHLLSAGPEQTPADSRAVNLAANLAANLADNAAQTPEAEDFSQLLQLGEAGDVRAQTRLAELFERGDGAPEDPLEAVRWLRRAALQGGKEAQYELGLRYAEGRGVSLDAAKAMQWLRRSAEQQSPDAQNVLGEIHVESNGPRAVEWFRQAAAQAHPGAIYNLAACHYNGFGVKQDFAEAFRLFQRSAEMKHAPAVDMLGECYQRGAGVIADEVRAVEYFRAAAAEQCSRAMISLGACYEFGEGVLKDPREAVHWYKAAAERNDPQGRYCLASCLESGTGIETNLLEAEAEYAAAAQYGHHAALARWAHLEQRRRRDRHDVALAEELLKRFEQAARDDDPSAIVQLGLFHEHWRPTAEPALAAACYQRAARLNDPRGQFLWGQSLFHGWLNSEGQRVHQDRSEALNVWRRSAEQGEAHADAALACAAYLGAGCERDLRESKRRLQACEDYFVWPDAAPEAIFSPAPAGKRGAKKQTIEAASNSQPESLGALLAARVDRGEPWAMYDLALCHEAGHGLVDDPALAHHWLSQAARRGLPEAQYQLAQHALAGSEAERNAWLEKATSQEYAPAITLLGERLLVGRGSPRDERRALALFLEAAEHGYPPAMANVGHCFDGGFGTVADRVRALYWYYKALSSEFTEVASSIRRLERNQNGSVIA